MEPLNADRAAALAADFMERVASRVEEARRFLDPGSGRTLAGRPRREEIPKGRFEEEIRLAMEVEGVYDDLLFFRLPRGRRVLWEVRGGGLFRRRTVLRILAGVVHPLRELIRGARPPPLEASAAGRLLPAEEGAEGPLVAAVLSTSGWKEGEEPAWPGGASVFLVAPAPGDGYRVASGPAETLPGFLAVESEAELRARVERYVEEARVELVLRGLEAGETSARTGVPLAIVRSAFEAAAREKEFLRLSEEGRTVVLRRA